MLGSIGLAGVPQARMRVRSARAAKLAGAVLVLVCGSGISADAQTAPGDTPPSAPAPVTNPNAVGFGQRALPRGINPETVAAIDRGLSYLARKQDRQGSWSNLGGYGAYPVPMTALAGLALLMDGNTTTQGRYAPQVDRAARYLQRSSLPSGLIAQTENEARPMYGHGFGMLFLSQLLGMTETPERAREIREVLQRGVVVTGKAQSRDGGWIYTPGGGGDEGSVTVTQVQALRSCRNVGVAVPKNVIDQAMAYLANSQNSDGGIRYALRQAGGSSRPPLAAAAVCCWYNAGEYTNPRAARALGYCKETLKPDEPSGGHDFYAHFYYAQALYLSRMPFWDEYFPKRRDLLLSQQRSDGSWQGDGVGDVYGTAIALVILQLPFNQLPIMQP